MKLLDMNMSCKNSNDKSKFSLNGFDGIDAENLLQSTTVKQYVDHKLKV